MTWFCRTCLCPHAWSGVGNGRGHACRKETGEKGKGFGRAEPAALPGTSGQQKVVLKQDKKWELKPAATEEWEAWAQAQKEAAGVTGDDFYVQVKLPALLQFNNSSGYIK